MDSLASDKDEAREIAVKIDSSLEEASEELKLDYFGGHAAFVDSGLSVGIMESYTRYLKFSHLARGSLL